MNICHLHQGTNPSLKAIEICKCFEESTFIKIETLTKIIDYDIYLIEITNITKKISLQLKTLFSTKANPLIYFLTSKDYSLMLVQLTFLLNSKSFITYTQETQKIVLKIKNDYKTHEEINLQTILGKSLMLTECFLLFKNKKLLYANKKLLENFGLNSFKEVQEQILLNLNLNSLFDKDNTTTVNLTNRLDIEKKYTLRSVTLNNEDEKLIYFNRITNKQNSELSFIHSRLSFIELLKDKIIEKSISQKSFSIITIQIENIQKLSNELSEVDLETLMKDFLLQVEILLEKNLILSQYDSDYYVTLFEDVEFEILKNKAQTFHSKITDYLKKYKYVPIIGIHVYELQNEDLNDVLEVLKHIHLNSLSLDILKKLKIKYINDIENSMSEEEAIHTLLDTTYRNSLEFKLLNIYNGLVINTASKIINKKDKSIYVTFELLQGVVLKEEGQTVLQSSNFIKDIKANVKFVSMDKKVAILGDFIFLNSNANARKHSRVTTSTKIVVSIGVSGATISGEILDISVNSIAVKVNYAKILQSIKNQDVILSFVLPSKKGGDENTFKIKAKAVFNTCDGSSCKIVTELYKDESNEAMLMEYVYNRQKELILELKKLAKLEK